jgi:hypothetical protein
LGKTHRERDEECKEKEDAFHKNVNERLNHYRCKVAKKCGNEQIFLHDETKTKGVVTYFFGGRGIFVLNLQMNGKSSIFHLFSQITQNLTL